MANFWPPWESITLSPIAPTPSDRRLVNKATYLTRIAIERQTSETKLKQINESLEQKVERRTRDLEAVVENLQEQIRERETAENKLRVQTQVLEQTLKDLQHTQMQMVQSEKMSSLGQLVAGIAHEINNPINFIHGNLSHIEDYSTSLFSIIEGYRKKYSDSSVIDGLVGEGELAFLEEDSRDLVRSMRIGTKRIKGIVRSLRNFARLDEAEYKTVDVHDGIDSALVILGSRLKGTGLRRMIKVEKKYQALPHVDCFPGQLNQVFMNVLSNAIDAIEDRAKLMGGFEEKGIFHIAIATRQVEGDLEGQEEHSHVEIAISDRGQGIKPESQPHIFNPFFTTKAVGQGTGLGMSISYQIITQQHNGSLTCESQWGKGTTFRIRIPIHQSL
ncbi:MAG: sensor histidine kinase [Cyanophyceae cyanobacterium]